MQLYLLVLSGEAPQSLCLAEVDAMLLSQGLDPAAHCVGRKDDPDAAWTLLQLPSDAVAARVLRPAVLVKYYLTLCSGGVATTLHAACDRIRQQPAVLEPFLNVGGGQRLGSFHAQGMATIGLASATR